ncbi:MAG: hypothetical protein R3E53_15300 [Myxococcota bacterium]
MRLARLGVLIEGFQQAVLEPFEFTSSDYGVLASLRRAGRPTPCARASSTAACTAPPAA